jgi:hypothetical protein
MQSKKKLSKLKKQIIQPINQKYLKLGLTDKRWYNPNFFVYIIFIVKIYIAMPKYKISKSNLREFFGLFGKKNPPEKIQKIIDNDPTLQKLRADYKKVNDKFKPRIDKIKDEDPELFKILQDAGMIPKDY